LRFVFAPFLPRHLISQDGKLQDELEITARVLGQKGGYSGTIVLVRNKATGEIIAEGRHSLFGKHHSKL
jgi:acyl-coenzyme A thioesterase 13